ncbi:MAG: hypothetical protein V1689_04030 [Pseudomonadota bacterium]
MKNLLLLVLVFFVMIPGSSNSEDFLGAPVVPGGKIVEKTDARLELETRLSHDELAVFYEEALKGLKDIKFRKWNDATYIEDDGNRPWHSITISKTGKNGESVLIVKDNWTWIIGTLVLRYIGVFVVLMVLLLGMSISGQIISRAVKRLEAKRQGQEG